VGLETDDDESEADDPDMPAFTKADKAKKPDLWITEFTAYMVKCQRPLGVKYNDKSRVSMVCKNKKCPVAFKATKKPKKNWVVRVAVFDHSCARKSAVSGIRQASALPIIRDVVKTNPLAKPIALKKLVMEKMECHLTAKQENANVSCCAEGKNYSH
jgi:hypothetical protein